MQAKNLLRRALTSRCRGRGAYALAAVRATGGALFIAFSISKFSDHNHEAHDFRHYGIPIPNVAVPAVGGLELIGGTLLVLGLLTRPAALVLAANLIGAILTAGRVDGGSFNLGVAPAMLAVMLIIVWAGPGAPACDALLLQRLERRHILSP